MNAPLVETNIAEALAWARKRIQPHEARLLLRHICRTSAALLAAWPEKNLAISQWEDFQHLVGRRATGEPIAYLTGEREFYGRAFLVNASVLIPRPETELLIELAVARFSAVFRPKVLDLGTGSGVLAVTLALELDHPEITAIDASRDALAVATSNALRHHAGISFLWSDWYASLKREDRFQLIVSNPPYIVENDPHLTQGDLRFEPLAALASGRDGLCALTTIIAGASRHLKNDGWLFLEHGYNQATAVRGLLADAGFANIASWKDIAGIERVSAGCWTG
ncbi:MAG: peptide chain release factor N(5)-glutamine methyltransferase [Azoarcus sp.]|jgi:release factor glutamine methyltransferase|nr:peptide chain release factor N(5)-glutamine methyltransferase [Azoarcus sp.]